MRENWYRSENELDRLRQAGVDDGVVDAAVSAFILGRRGQFGGIYTQYNKWIARNLSDGLQEPKLRIKTGKS